MRFDVLTLFPEIFSGYMTQSLLKLAIDRSLVSIRLHNIRDWSRDKHKCVDDRPFGGGPGMVLKPEPVVEAVEAVRGRDDVLGQGEPGHGALGQGEQEQDEKGHLVLLTPQGRQLDQTLVEELATHSRLLLLCGRYEGFDQRVTDLLEPDEISVGDYVLNGGEVAAMTLIDTVIRLVPGVLGDEDSSRYDSFSASVGDSCSANDRNSCSSGGRLLEHAQYTRPREYRGLQVPEVLLSGDHTKIAKWREENSQERTRKRRPDLLNNT